MRRALALVLAVMTGILLVGRGVAGCGNLDEYYKTFRLSRHSRGSAIDISEDDSRVVVVNRDPGTVTVFPVTYGAEGPKLGEPVRIPKVCADNLPPDDAGEPWQVVIHPNGDTAYVVCRSAQVVVEIVGLRSSNPRVTRRVAVGSEPTGIALTPRGSSAWVANWMDGTVSRIDTASMTVTGEIDLNKSLVGDGYLGPVSPRPALAHPRSIAISNDGDDDENDETMVVTEFFAQTNPDIKAADDPDTRRVGVVYKVSLDSDPPAVRTITLQPTSLGAYVGKDKAPGSCFPNQLQSVTINGARESTFFFAYVTSICASPKGPVGVETMVSPAITVIDLKENVTVKFGTIPLNASLMSRYDPDRSKGPDKAFRLPLLTNDLAFLPRSYDAVVTAGGADAVFRMRFDPVYEGNPITVEADPFVDLTRALDPAYPGPVGPIGVAMAHGRPIAFTANDGARSVAVVDAKVTTDAARLERFLGSKSSTAFPPAGEPSDVAKGKRLFNFGLGKWSRGGQGWGACSECHIDGLTDNVTWYFPRGPRQTLSVDTFFQREKLPDGSVAQRHFGWVASFDEVTDLDIAVIQNFFGGPGLLVRDPEGREKLDLTNDRGLNGSSTKQIANSAVDDWTLLIAYMKKIRTPRRPSRLDERQIVTGLEVARKLNCGGCHGGPEWTISTRFYVPGDTFAGATSVNTELTKTVWSYVAELSDILPTTTAQARKLRYPGTNAGVDSLTCALREVGTYGVFEAGVLAREVRDDMASTAQGGREKSSDELEPKGFNPPSLLGLAAGAPYFHAGNARTLEAVFSRTFEAHWKALAKDGALSDEERQALITFLLSIDRRGVTDPNQLLDIPDTFGPKGGRLCPITFPP